MYSPTAPMLRAVCIGPSAGKERAPQDDKAFLFDEISGRISRRPRIDQANAAVFEIGGIARRQNCSAGASDGRDLRVQVGDRTASRAAAGCDHGKRACGVLVKGENPACEIFRECRLGLGKHFIAALPVGKKFDAEEDFGDGDAGDKEMAVLRLL